MTKNFEFLQVDVSNVGGGPATSLELEIHLYELDGKGPVKTTKGGLRRIESINEGVETKTLGSSIRPSEINISFEAESKSVLPMGSNVRSQDSLAKIVANELDGGKDVIYGKVSINYLNMFAEEGTYNADFSLKFTRQGELRYEVFDYLPWTEEHRQPAFGG